MQIPILIEPIDGGRYRARAGEPFAQTAEGESAREAARTLEEQLIARLLHGATMVFLDIPNGKPVSDQTASFPGDNLYESDWAFQELQEAITENRRVEENAGA
jgi:hypothetical protein